MLNSSKCPSLWFPITPTYTSPYSIKPFHFQGVLLFPPSPPHHHTTTAMHDIEYPPPHQHPHPRGSYVLLPLLTLEAAAHRKFIYLIEAVINTQVRLTSGS